MHTYKLFDALTNVSASQDSEVVYPSKIDADGIVPSWTCIVEAANDPSGGGVAAINMTIKGSPEQDVANHYFQVGSFTPSSTWVQGPSGLWVSIVTILPAPIVKFRHIVTASGTNTYSAWLIQ